MRRATNAVELMSLLPWLHDLQSELLLLRSCMSISKLFFGLRTCQLVHMEEATLFFDKGLHWLIENIMVCGGPFFRDLQWLLASLSIRFGGLGLYSAKVGSSYAFVASRAQSWVLQKDIEVHFDMTMRHKVVFECLRAPHAQDFLLAIPIDGLGQHMSPVEYHTILKYRLMIPLFLVDAICPVCRKACLDSFREHVVHCKELTGFKYRHDMVRDVLFDKCRHAGISTKKEAPMNVWVGGKYACMDLTRVSPIVGLSSRGFTMGQAALKAASCKVTKHEKTCIEIEMCLFLLPV
ncbi:hypothetical protein Tco_1110028 [Tanacetum coccineum]|uniref:Reverse transcriptase zinc-binding domain-containing protein n=1 Tax=Tanacetum coccineum TaxID=301880 RepID=A0ABQ5IJ18_9ASTR